MNKMLPHEKTYLKKLVTHTPDKCEGRHCCVHNPSDHHMRSWKMNYRFDKGIMERICPEHGVGHPDPDDAAYWLLVGKPWMTIHGCCGCCDEADIPRISICRKCKEYANLLIKKLFTLLEKYGRISF